MTQVKYSKGRQIGGAEKRDIYGGMEEGKGGIDFPSLMIYGKSSVYFQIYC